MVKRTVVLPQGRLLLSVRSGMLCQIRLAQADELFEDCDPVLDLAQNQLLQYFAGERQRFDLPVCVQGTAFERAVWQQLQKIPFGEIRTYGQIAAALGNPMASRAVGSACARNPLLIVVPCHRVIAGSGKLTGFAAGMQMKTELLMLEGWHIRQERVYSTK
ncbi:MAG: methylated-DNA--[Clostridia bacterium]|nr:methylated-DNA--[protein]-cysteine S-methyltransferase [Clostridia bacterium]